MNPAIAILFISIALGSFGNNVISYLSGKSKFNLSRSICFCGERELKLYELVPIFSYLFQSGRCSNCGKPISLRYLLVEIFSAVLAIVLFVKYGITVTFALQFMVFFTLLLIAIIDSISFTIPNSLVFILLLVGLGNLFFYPSTVIINLVAAFAVTFFLLLLNKIILIYKMKEGIGFGDIKLIFVLFIIFEFPLAIVGLWLSASIALITVFISWMIPSIKPVTYTKVPFGLFLAIGYFLANWIPDTLIYNFPDIFGEYL